jgi:predicted lipoprotein with Yx(FWY)xxD motif
MHKRFIISLLVTAAMLAACGGGGSSGPAPGAPAPPLVTPVPTAVPTATPAPAGNLPASDTVGGAPAWVDPSSHHTLYYLDVDTATGGTCTAACLGLWPVFVPSAGAVGTGNMTIITRSDGTGQQWAYQGRPLYRYAGDSTADQANGDGIPDFGGHWHVARTVAATAPPGGQTPPPCSNIYC